MASETKNDSENKDKKKKKKVQKLKLPKTSKPLKSDKIGFKQKFNRFSTKTKNQFTGFYDRIVHNERQFVDGQEPPPSYSFKKRFYGLYVIFGVYSLILILAMNMSESTWINIITFGSPFAFSNAIVAFFLLLSILFSIDKVRVYIFEGKTALKQCIIYICIIGLFHLIFLYISTNLNFMTYLLSLAFIWLLLLSSRFYIYSRKFSTKIEARFIKRYSRMRYFLAVIVPFIILAVLVIVSLFYRSFLVFFSLDFIAPVDPANAVAVYIKEMRIIMPLIYLSLVLTLIFIIFEFISTRRRAETRRAGTFDNFTFSFIVLFIFFFQIMQISIFLLLQPETVAGLKSVFGAGNSVLAYIFIFEFVVSLYFLYRVIKKTGKTLGWRILFFKKDGLIMLCLACVFAQTFTRYAIDRNIPNQVIEGAGSILMADKYIISILMIIFLGTTILIYYLKPHETSMFMRLQKETINKEEQNIERIYKIIRSEFIRRGEAYPLEIIERELIKATQLSKGNIYDMIKILAKKDMDILLTEEKQDSGKLVQIINFMSVTERFEKKGVAQQKAKKYLSERLFETAHKKEKMTSRLLKSADSDAKEDSFVASLTDNFSRKQKDKIILQKKLDGTEISFVDQTDSLKNQIISIIKKEYIYRIEKPAKNPEFFIPVSEISNEIESATKVNPGELYLILGDLNKTDLELRLAKNPDEPEDKLIKFLPYSDDKICYSLAMFRYEEYAKFRIMVIKRFWKDSTAKRDRKKSILQLKKGIPNQTESQQSWIAILNLLHKDYAKYIKQLNTIPDKNKVLKLVDDMIKDYEKRQIILNS